MRARPSPSRTCTVAKRASNPQQQRVTPALLYLPSRCLCVTSAKRMSRRPLLYGAIALALLAGLVIWLRPQAPPITRAQLIAPVEPAPSVELEPSATAGPSVVVTTDPETQAMASLRDAVTKVPRAALRELDRLDEQFPRGQFSEERGWLRVRSLVNLQEIGAARAASTRFYERFPDSPLGERVESLTGQHRPMPPPF